MGFFEKIFGTGSKAAKVPEKAAVNDFKMLTTYAPSFVDYNGQMYEQELVRAAINALAVNIGKLRVEFYGRGSQYLEKRLKRPNEFQTWGQFLERTATIYYADNTAFIVPAVDAMGRVTAVYPVLPSRCKMVSVNNEPWLAFEFASGRFAQVPVWRVGTLRRHQYRNDMFGENNRALDSTLNMIEVQNQGVTEAVKSAATYRFMAQMGNLALGNDIGKAREDFNKQNFGSGAKGGGLILFPSQWNNIQQVSSKPFVIDADQQRLIKENVCDYFGVNDDVLQNKAYGDKWTAFYEGAIEPFAIQFSDVMTFLFLMNGELTGDEAGVMATANRLQYMSTAEKLNVSSQLADRGVLNRDEVREIWNLPPLPDEQGKEYIIRGEYTNAANKINEEGNDDAGET